MTDYAWRPSYRAPDVVHIAIEGQTRWTCAGSQLRWVWAVCAEHVDPDRGEPPGAARCPDCLSWLTERGPQMSQCSDSTQHDGHWIDTQVWDSDKQKYVTRKVWCDGKAK